MSTYQLNRIAFTDIKPGYRTFTGKVFDVYDCNAYNAYNRELRAYCERDIVSGSETDAYVQRLLDNRHKVFCSVSQR